MACLCFGVRKKGAKSNWKKGQIINAAKSGNSEMAMACMLQAPKATYYAQTWGGQTAWHVAARHGHTSVLKAMASVLSSLSPSQLRLLSKLGKTPELILDRVVNDYDSKALTPLHLACIYDHAEVAGFLMECSANPFMMDYLGRTPLHYASSLGHVDCINAILSGYNGPKESWHIPEPNSENTRLVDVRTASGFAPLHYAVWADNQASILALSSYEARLDVVNSQPEAQWVVCGEGFTPLHLAALRGDFETVKLLLAGHVQAMAAGTEVMAAAAGQWGQRQAGDPRYIRNKRGMMPYHVALAKGHHHLAELLHPDIPYTFIFSNNDMQDNVRMFGPPRLMVIAAGVLQRKLLQELDAVQQQATLRAAGQQQQVAGRGGEEGAGIGGKDAARSPMGSLEQRVGGGGKQQQRQAAPAGGEDEGVVGENDVFRADRGSSAAAVAAALDGDGDTEQQQHQGKQDDAQQQLLDQGGLTRLPPPAAEGSAAVGYPLPGTETDCRDVAAPDSSMEQPTLSPFLLAAQNTWSLSNVSQTSLRKAVAAVLGTAASGATSATGDTAVTTAAGAGVAGTSMRGGGGGTNGQPSAHQLLGPLESGALGVLGDSCLEEGLQGAGAREQQSGAAQGHSSLGPSGISPVLQISAYDDGLDQQEEDVLGQQQQLGVGPGRALRGVGLDGVDATAAVPLSGEELEDSAAARTPAAAGLGTRWSGLSGWLAWSRAAATSSAEPSATAAAAAAGPVIPPQPSAATPLPDLTTSVSLAGCLPRTGGGGGGGGGGGSHSLENISSGGKYGSRAASPRGSRSGYEGSVHGGGLLRHVWSANIEDLLAEASREKGKERWKEEKVGGLRRLRRSSTGILQYQRGRDGKSRWRLAGDDAAAPGTWGISVSPLEVLLDKKAGPEAHEQVKRTVRLMKLASGVVPFAHVAQGALQLDDSVHSGRASLDLALSGPFTRTRSVVTSPLPTGRDVQSWQQNQQQQQHHRRSLSSSTVPMNLLADAAAESYTSNQMRQQRQQQQQRQGSLPQYHHHQQQQQGSGPWGIAGKRAESIPVPAGTRHRRGHSGNDGRWGGAWSASPTPPRMWSRASSRSPGLHMGTATLADDGGGGYGAGVGGNAPAGWLVTPAARAAATAAKQAVQAREGGVLGGVEMETTGSAAAGAGGGEQVTDGEGGQRAVQTALPAIMAQRLQCEQQEQQQQQAEVAELLPLDTAAAVEDSSAIAVAGGGAVATAAGGAAGCITAGEAAEVAAAAGPTAPGAAAAVATEAGGVAGEYIPAAGLEVEGEGMATATEDWESEEGGCEICFDEKACVELQRCGHALCATCAREMCKLHHFKPALCPFCRQIIRELRLLE